MFRVALATAFVMAIASTSNVARADAETERKISSIVIVVRVNGRDVNDAHIIIDGVLVADKLDGRAITLDPGSHHIRIDRADGTLFDEQDVIIHEGEKNRAIELVRDESVVKSIPRPHTLAPWVVVGAGAVIEIVGVAILVLAQEHTFTNDNTASTMSTVGPVLMGVGGAAILAGLLWHFAEPTATRVARIAPMVTPTFAGATFRLTF